MWGACWKEEGSGIRARGGEANPPARPKPSYGEGLQRRRRRPRPGPCTRAALPPAHPGEGKGPIPLNSHALTPHTHAPSKPLFFSSSQVAKQDKKKTPKGRAKKRLQYNRRFVNVVTGPGKKRGPNSNPTQ